MPESELSLVKLLISHLRNSLKALADAKAPPLITARYEQEFLRVVEELKAFSLAAGADEAKEGPLRRAAEKLESACTSLADTAASERSLIITAYACPIATLAAVMLFCISLPDYVKVIVGSLMGSALLFSAIHPLIAALLTISACLVSVPFTAYSIRALAIAIASLAISFALAFLAYQSSLKERALEELAKSAKVPSSIRLRSRGLEDLWRKALDLYRRVYGDEGEALLKYIVMQRVRDGLSEYEALREAIESIREE